MMERTRGNQWRVRRLRQSMRAVRAVAAAAFTLASGACDRGPVSYPLEHCPVVINEFMSKNTTDSIVHETGASEDWVEVYNTSDTPFDLSLLQLSDDSTDLGAYTFPDTFIAGRGYYLVWADDSAAQGPNHANFKLGATHGDELILSSRQGRIFDRIQFFVSSGRPEARQENVSYGRTADGDSQWVPQARPTPGAPNVGP